MHCLGEYCSRGIILPFQVNNTCSSVYELILYSQRSHGRREIAKMVQLRSPSLGQEYFLQFFSWEHFPHFLLYLRRSGEYFFSSVCVSRFCKSLSSHFFLLCKRIIYDTFPLDFVEEMPCQRHLFNISTLFSNSDQWSIFLSSLSFLSFLPSDMSIRNDNEQMVTLLWEVLKGMFGT